MPRILPTALAAFTLASSAATANQIDPRWQADRAHYNAMADRACDGDATAWEDLSVAAWTHENPAAQHNMAWVYFNQGGGCDPEGMIFDAVAAQDLQYMSADQGYPFGLYGLGMMMLEGRFGHEVDPVGAAEFLGYAAEFGVALAAAQLALIYAEGNGVAPDRNRSEAYMRDAEAMGLSQATLSEFATRIAAAVPGVGQAPTNTVIAGGAAAPLTGSGAGAYFRVLEQRTTNVRIGDRIASGNYDFTVVFVAEGFNVGNGVCYVNRGPGVVAHVATPNNEYGVEALEALIAQTDGYLAEGSGHPEHFRDLAEGIAIVGDIQRGRGIPGISYVWRESEARALMEPCSTNAPTVYPEPVFAPGYGN